MKKILYLLIIALFSIQLQGYCEDYQSVYLDAVNALKAGNYQKAEKYYTKLINKAKAIKINDNGVYVFYEDRGLCYLMLEKNDEALKDFLTVIKLNPSNAEIYCYIAKIKRQKKEYDSALTYLNKALSLAKIQKNEKLYHEAYMDRCHVYIDKHDFDTAYHDIEEEIKRNPEDNPKAYSLRATLCFLIGKKKSVMEAGFKDLLTAIEQYQKRNDIDSVNIEKDYYDKAQAVYKKYINDFSD